jgi:transcription termination factor Rho
MKKTTSSSPDIPMADAPIAAKKAARKTPAKKAAAAIVIPDETPAASPAKKAAVKKTAAPAAAAPLPLAIEEPNPAAKKAVARKTAAKKAVAATSVPDPTSLPEPSPAKPSAKKAAAKKTPSPPPAEPPVAAAPPAPIPAAEPLFVLEDTPAPKARAPRKAAAKKAAAPAADTTPADATDAASPAPQPDNVPEAPPSISNGSDYHPDQNRFQSPPPREARAPRDHREPRPPYRRDPNAQDQAGHAHPSGPRPPQYPPREPRPYPPRDSADSHAPSDHQRQSPPDQRQAPEPQSMELGPDGQPRRLTKWERWKLRKEKFKQQKQQRYLERTGRLPAPGPNGEPGTPEGEAREPRPDNRTEPRTWEPRPPRPEIPLGPPEPCEGLLEMTDKGFAFLRPKDRGYVPSPTDPFVSAELVRQHGLREGVWVEGIMQRGGRGPQVMELKKVNGLEPSAYRTLPLFEELTAINPNKRYILETEAKRHTTRLIDFISPIGRGQRGLIVAPPRAGKTTFLQHIAEAVLENYKDVKVIVLLVDERPEEVTEIARALPGAEIMASSNDQDPRNHIRMANLAIERAKRLVEAGQHVFMLLDSITRLARGFNNSMRGGSGGKAMSGGLDSRALEAPRRLFAAARNTREAGSLTIMATALVETNNKGDDLIFQEFKGTGNMELVLDRKISQAYVYPAVDIFKSGTRREELLLPAHQLEKVHLIRRGLSGHRPQEAVERLLQVMGKYNNNNQMLIEIKARGE